MNLSLFKSFLGLKCLKINIHNLQNCQNGIFWSCKFSKNDFTYNLGGRKIMKFPHCVWKTEVDDLDCFYQAIISNKNIPEHCFKLYLLTIPTYMIGCYIINHLISKVFVRYTPPHVSLNFGLDVCIKTEQFPQASSRP